MRKEFFRRTELSDKPNNSLRPTSAIPPQHPGEPVVFGITVERTRPRSRNVKIDAIGQVETIGVRLNVELLHFSMTR